MGRARIALVALGAIALAIAGWAGLGRTQLVPVLPFGAASERHGALMITAIAILISLERATVVRRRWAWLAPVLATAASVAIVVGAPSAIDAFVSLGASLVLVFVMLRGALATPAVAITLMAAGAFAWLVSAALRADGFETARVVPWWIAFLVLTIAGERHELARILRPSRRATLLFFVAIATMCVGTALTLIEFTLGMRVLGAGLLAVGLWLGVRDRPLAASRAHPLSRFIGLATRLAYTWLVVGATFAVTFDGVPAGLRYDALLHAIFAGFVLSMVVAHAPIVIPAVVGGAFSYRPAIYLGLVVLTLSTLLRVAGDVVDRVDVRNAGAAGIGVGLALFAIATVASLRPRRAASDVAVRAVGLR